MAGSSNGDTIPDSPLWGGPARVIQSIGPDYDTPGVDSPRPPQGGLKPRPELARIAQQRQLFAISRLPFADLPPETIAGIIRDMEIGRLERPADLWAKCKADAVVGRCHMTRSNAVTSRPIGVEPNAAAPSWKKANAQANADFASMLVAGLESSGAMEQALLNQLTATVMGLNVLRTDWGMADGWWLPEKFAPILTRDLRLDLDWTPLFRDQSSQWHRVAAHPGRFWTHRPMTTNGLLADQGTFRGVAWLSYFKAMLMRFRLFSAERYGTPLIVGYLEQIDGQLNTAPQSVRETLRDTLKQLTIDSVIVAPNGTRIDVVDPKGVGSAQLYKEAIDSINAEIQIQMLGMTTMFEPGANGSRSAEETRNGVRLESTAQDSRLVLGSFVRDVVAWGIAYNGLDTDPACLPTVKTIFEQKEKWDGNQVGSLQSLLTSVATGQLPRESAAELIAQAFPIGPDDVEKILGTIGKGFTPAPPPANVTERITPGTGGVPPGDPTASGGTPPASPFPPRAKSPLGGMPDLSDPRTR